MTNGTPAHAVPAAHLAELSAAALIAQYDLAVRSTGDAGERQRRIDRIVELIERLADADDDDALDWLGS